MTAALGLRMQDNKSCRELELSSHLRRDIWRLAPIGLVWTPKVPSWPRAQQGVRGTFFESEAPQLELQRPLSLTSLAVVARLPFE
jgi:hypothetical protein